MPELPEVETVASQLRNELVGQRIKSSRIFDQKLQGNFEPLHGRRISAVERLGKQIVVSLTPAPLFLVVHLRMTGRLLWSAGFGDVVTDPLFYFDYPASEKSLRAEFVCRDGLLRFYDTRRFGTVELVQSLERVLPKGIEPLSPECTVTKVSELLSQSAQPLKNFLLRQDKIVGLGNIYASEILFASKLHPYQAANTLELKEVRQLHRDMQKILTRAIENCGTTFSDFQDSTGSLGNYQQFLKVYGREGERCYRCRAAEVERIVQAGRSTFLCPQCQPMPKRAKQSKKTSKNS
jgi:formamidopyrimidine-DNA glycosylase